MHENRWRYHEGNGLVSENYLEWRVHKDFPGYSFSNSGLIKDLLNDREVKTHKKQSGYLAVNLRKRNVYRRLAQVYVHRIICELFRPGYSEIVGKVQVLHKDGDKSNNHIDNLYIPTIDGRVDRPVRRNRNLYQVSELGVSWTVQELASYLGVKASTIRKAVSIGKMPYRGLTFTKIERDAASHEDK